MSTAAPITAHTDTASQTPSSVDQLVRRLAAEVDAAEERLHSLRTEAAKVFVGRGQRVIRFVAVADRIHAILLSRLKTFTNMNVFQDIKQSVSPELQVPDGQGRLGRTTTLSLPYSDKRPAPMEFSFRVDHDDPIRNAVIDYRLQILPAFIKFDNHGQLLVSIDEPSEEAISAWIDDKLVGFTKTYFEVYFNNEYQKKTLETDPVMHIRFPKAFAAEKMEYGKRTHYFYTKESFHLFERNPSEYFETASKSPVAST